MTAIKAIQPLGFPWPTQDPFLFCAYHHDQYPRGNGQFAPDDDLSGRQIGQDFVIKDGYRLYHGHPIPGFPAHPHRGFETVTVVQQGVVDHADSLGGAGRYRDGDVQWMTAGSGIQHSEIFPLLHQHRDNPLELMQIWLNLPAKHKMVDPFYQMLWREQRLHVQEQEGVSVQLIYGQLGPHQAKACPPHSWAKEPDSDVVIALIEIQAGVEFELPKAGEGLNRSLYFYQGDELHLDQQVFKQHSVAQLHSHLVVSITAPKGAIKLLLLQGRPIGEPVAQYGPFVMNNEAELHQAFADYRATEFGGWPWPDASPVHQGDRFARHSLEGEIENP